MNKHIIDGFIKEARAHGISQEDAFDLFKVAVKHEDESSYMGRYMNYIGHRQQNMVEHPVASFVASLPGGSMVDGLPLTAGTGDDEKSRSKELKRQQDDLSERSYMGNAGKGALNIGIGGGLGGVANGGLAALLAKDSSKALPFIASHGAAGALGGVAAGGLVGLLSKAINKHTSEKSKASARGTLSKHPYRQSLPFADMIASGSE